MYKLELFLHLVIKWLIKFGNTATITTSGVYVSMVYKFLGFTGAQRCAISEFLKCWYV